MKSVRLNEKPSPWGLFQVKTSVFGDLGLSQPKRASLSLTHIPQVTNFVDPLKLSPFLSYPTEVFCYTQSCGTVAAFFHYEVDLSPFSERGSSSQYEKSPFGIGTALGLPGQN